MAGWRHTRSSAVLRGTLFFAALAGGAGGWAWAETAVVTWGHSEYGGSLPEDTRAALEAAPGIARLVGNSGAFAAVTTEGRWYTWGNSDWGGSLPEDTRAALEAAPGIARLVGPDWAFAAVTTEGRWYTWGTPYWGGSLPEHTRAALEAAPGIVWLVGTHGAFAAVLCVPGDYAFSRFESGSMMCYPEVSCGPGFTQRANLSNTTSSNTYCSRCPTGTFSAAGASSCKTTCSPDLYPDEANNNSHCIACRGSEREDQRCSFGWRVDGTSLCPEGTDVDRGQTVQHFNGASMAYPTLRACTECPHRLRCPGVGNCSEGATGNLCGSCDQGFFNLGPLCQECSASPLLPLLTALVAAAVALRLLWRLTDVKGLAPTDVNCVLSFGSRQGGFEIALELKRQMLTQFDWPDDSVYIDSDAMEHKPETVRTERSDAEGNTYFVSLNPYWHIYFRESVCDSPSMLFSLTPAWCDSPYCKQELVWYLVLKTMGANELLRVEVDQSGVTSNLETHAVVERVKSMPERDRAGLWDGAFFLASHDVLESSTVTLLRELGCPSNRIAGAGEMDSRERLLVDLERFVVEGRTSPELIERRKDFLRGYIATPLSRQVSQSNAGRVDTEALRKTMKKQAAQMLTLIRAQLASIVLPHLSFSWLPLLLPNLHLPVFIVRLATWLRSIVFLDIGMLTQPDCFTDSSSASAKKMLRFMASHGCFWLTMMVFAAVGFQATSTGRNQSVADHAVNASVWMFVLMYAMLLSSCLETLHCVGVDQTLWAGHLLADPDTTCDARTTVAAL
eukprot:COSAG02_NODE_8687_length_2479_cov_1.220168_1_plen_787_part_01